MARRKRKSSRKRSSKKGLTLSLNAAQKALIAGIGLIFFTAIMVLSLLSPTQGQLTSLLSGLMWQAFGWGGLFVPVVLAGMGFYLVLWGMEQAPPLPTARLFGVVMFFFTFEAFASLIGVVWENGLPSVWAVAQAQTGGGYLGGALAWALMKGVGQIGAIFVLAVLGLMAAVLMLGITRKDLVQLGQFVRAQIAAWRAGQEEIPVNVGRGPRRAIRRGRARPESTDTTAAAASRPGPPIINTPAQAAAEPADTPEKAQPRRRRRPEADAEDTAAEQTPTPIFLGDDTGGRTPSWELPAMGKMLEPGGEQEINNATIREQVEVIEHTLESFGAPATVVEINQGPTVTQFGVEPQFIERRNGKRTKVKVGKIASLADDLTLALAAHSVRVQAPVPGRGYVGIEVPNVQKSLVSLRDVMESNTFQQVDSPLRLGLGQDVSGHPIVADLAKMPHLLIAGATGSGKSVCVNSIVASLLLQNTPEDLKLVMVDPKRVELTGYNGVPHLVAPVVVDMERVIATLQWAMREMDERYDKLSAMGARNIFDYNKKVEGSNRRKLPFIVIFIDELADLMMVSPDETERSITRLAQMSRATGIHMVIATQRPSVDVVTGLIKANFPARIAFAVASGTDSRVILDSTGAERLLGEGDMLFQSPDAGTPVRMQGSFVSDRELGRIIRYWRGARRFNRYTAADAETRGAGGSATTEAAEAAPPPIQQPLWEDLIEEAADEPEYEDELIPEAIELVRELDKASTSLLQRRFRIGYTRAARIMDYMEEEGIIGPPTGTSKAREVVDSGGGEETAETEGDDG